MNTSDVHHKLRVLVFPAGTEIGLEIYAALKDCKEIQLFAAGQNTPNHAQFLYDTYHIVPSVHDDTYVSELSKLIKKLHIDFIYPAHDDALVALTRDAHHFDATILAPSETTCRTTRSKSQTYHALHGIVPVPKLFDNPTDVHNFPVIVKPDKGQGSWGVVRANTAEMLVDAVAATDDCIICEYLPGEEYTIDCFSHQQQGLLFAGARIRMRMRNGIAVHTRTVDLPEAMPYAEAINNTLNLRGAWFFQAKRAQDGTLTILEVAPRIAGSMSTHRMQGINFAWLTILEMRGFSLSILRNPSPIIVDRALQNRYRHNIQYRELYIDLDDTILHQNQIHTGAVQLIYQSLNQQKRVILLTRHKGNLLETLSQYRLTQLFDEIIHLEPHQKKSQFITSSDAIFVDDSFAERLDVAQRCAIPTFDLHMIDLLLHGTYDPTI